MPQNPDFPEMWDRGLDAEFLSRPWGGGPEGSHVQVHKGAFVSVHLNSKEAF